MIFQIFLTSSDWRQFIYRVLTFQGYNKIYIPGHEKLGNKNSFWHKSTWKTLLRQTKSKAFYIIRWVPFMCANRYVDISSVLCWKLSFHICQAFLTSSNCESGIPVFASSIATQSLQGYFEIFRKFETSGRTNDT